MPTSPFAVRFPKTVGTGTFTNVGFKTLPGAPGRWMRTNDSGLLVAPARYSQPRKVIFWATARYLAAVATQTYRLIAGYAANSSVDSNPRTLSLAPGAFVQAPTDFSYFVHFDAAPPFAEMGPPSVISFNASLPNHTKMLQVEFDITNPAHSDFWDVWNAMAAAGDSNSYMMFYHGVDSNGLGTASEQGNWLFDSYGITIVQAPSANNKTCTTTIQANGSLGEQELLPTAFNSATTMGRSTWQYNVNEWDGLVSITGVMWGRTQTGSANPISFRLSQKLPTVITGVHSETSPNTTASTARGYFWRTIDFKSLLVDGATYALEWIRNSATQHTVICSQIEIVQENCTRTTTYHDAMFQIPIIAFTTTANEGAAVAALFDPTWYQNSLERLRKRILYGSLLHASAGNDPQVVLHGDADLTANHHSLTGTSATIFTIFPDVSGTPNAVVDTKPKRAAITSNDPIDRAGQIKMTWGKAENHTWNAGGNDTWGHLGIYYTYDVPNTEIPEIGDVFETSAFNPEGCAATAAGGGDPGILAITNGSTIPVKFDPQAGHMEDLGVPRPFEGETPTATDSPQAISPDNLGLVNGSYVYRYTFRNCCTGKESDPNPDDIVVEVTAGGGGFNAQVTLAFANVVIPGDPQICEICVYRSVAGGAFPVMAKVGCFDPDVNSQFVDAKGDEQLDFTGAGLSILNAPPPCAPIVIEFKNRLHMLGDIPDNSPVGTVSATQDSDIIIGSDDVEWDRCLEGKFIQLEGDCRPYEIDRVLPPTVGTSPAIQRLKLVEPYQESTKSGRLYVICGHANRWWYSEPFEPECWPIPNFIDIEPGDGDRLMGGCSNFDRLVICKRRKTYVATWSDTPLEVNVPTRISSDIGCIAARSYAQVEVGTVWLSDRGLALYDGRGVQHIPESQAINDIFTDPEHPLYVRRDAMGRVIDAVGVFYPKREQYLLLLPTVRSTRGCDLMLVWDVQLRNITLVEFCQEFQSMVVAKDTDGNQRVYLGDTNGFVWIFDVGHTDGVGSPGSTGTVRGFLTDGGTAENGVSFLEDSTATFIEGGLPELADLSGTVGLSGAVLEGDLGIAGVCVYVRENAQSEWIQRLVFAATQTRVFVTPSWPTGVVPTAGWEYMLGPIEFDIAFKPTNFGTDDMLQRQWRMILVHEPETFASEVKVELLPDFSAEDPDEGAITADDGTTSKGRVFDMSYPRGRQTHPIGRTVHKHLAVRMRNFAPESPVRIINLALAVEVRNSK